jgi:predicted  nucleic acid-binding Zn-ribbon protein
VQWEAKLNDGAAVEHGLDSLRCIFRTLQAEQQIELQRQQHALARRMDTAARIVKNLQDDVADVQVRIGMLEDQLHPASYVTDAQATEVSNAVKGLAELLSSAQSGKNHYQGIFAELYRRFGVSSYKMIRQEQYKAVLRFLEDWRQAVKNESGESPE